MIIIALVAIVIALAVGLGVGLTRDDGNDESEKGTQTNDAFFKNGAVATDAKQCSEVKTGSRIYRLSRNFRYPTV